MANGFGSLYIGASGIRSNQNALNVVANNLSNLDTTGYVRQRTLFVDADYNKFSSADISNQWSGLGVDIGDVIHKRDQFLDMAYRSENGRYAFYNAGYEAAQEVETLLSEGSGDQFSDSITGLYDAFNEFAKTPDADEVENLVVQKSQLFLTRAQSVNKGLVDYQDNINQKINDDIDKINQLGHKIYKLNIEVASVESGHVETAMDARDARDEAIDELSKLTNVSVKEDVNGVVTVKVEGQDFVREDRVFEMGRMTEKGTGYVTPYWPHLSNATKNDYYKVYDTSRTATTSNQDIGEVKALLIARGDRKATYRDIQGSEQSLTDPDVYTSNKADVNRYNAGYSYTKTINPVNGEENKEIKGISKSLMMNEEAELDLMIHEMVTGVNNYFSPIESLGNLKNAAASDSTATEYNKTASAFLDKYNGQTLTATDGSGTKITIGENTRVLDEDNAVFGSDKQLPPRELFKRRSQERYTSLDVYVASDGTVNTTGAGEKKTLYFYNEEDPDVTSSQYTLDELEINHDLVENPQYIPHRHANDDIAYDVSEKVYDVWNRTTYQLNPIDTTPTNFANFYTKMVGELANKGNTMKTNSETIKDTADSIDSSRQQVIGVNADEELTNMIKYQNAYNASSRYVNVITQMIDVLLNSMT